MYIITGLVDGATLPHFRDGFQLASDEYLNKETTEMSPHKLGSVSKTFKNHAGYKVAHGVP